MFPLTEIGAEPTYARTTWMMTLAGMLLLFSGAPAWSGTFSLVEVRPGTDPFLRLTGAQELSPSIGLWRVPTRSVSQLREAGLVRLAEPERRIVPARQQVDPLLASEWWLGPVGAKRVVAPGPGVRSRWSTRGSALQHPEFAQRANAAALNTQNVANSLSDYHGTAVASVIAAPANEIGMVGIYPQAALDAYDIDLSGSRSASSCRESTPLRTSDASSSTSASGRPRSTRFSRTSSSRRSGAAR